MPLFHSIACSMRILTTPPITQFNQILGSLVKIKHYPIVIADQKKKTTPLLFPFPRNCNSGENANPKLKVVQLGLDMSHEEAEL